MRHGTRWFHTNQTFVLGSEQTHDRWLDDRYQRHIRIGWYRNRPHQVRRQFGWKEDGSRTVRTTDDTDSTGLHRVEAHGQRNHVCTEDTKLCGSTNQHQLGIGNQCREVGHCTDTEEDERRIPSRSNSLIQNVEYRPFFIDTDFKSGFHVERNITD